MRVDPTCGGRVGVDPCINPESAQCANPQDYAWGNGRWGITGADDPCVYLNNAGNGVESVDNNSSPKECRKTGGLWVPPGWQLSFNPDTSFNIAINNNTQPSNPQPWGICEKMAAFGGAWVGLGIALNGAALLADAGKISAPVGAGLHAGGGGAIALGGLTAGVGLGCMYVQHFGD